MPVLKKQKRRTQRQKARARKRRIRLLITCALACVFLYSTISLIIYGVSSRNTQNVNRALVNIHEAEEAAAPDIMPVPTDEPIAETVEEPVAEPEQSEPVMQRMTGTIPIRGLRLLNVNPDYVGWLKIVGLIDLPVVYRDNEYYLTHNFLGDESNSGTIFLDENHPIQEDTQYLLLHGHAMYDGSMFSYVTHFRHKDFIAEHPYLTFETLYSSDYYEIIGSVYLEEDEMVSIARMTCPVFDDEADFNEFIDGMRAHAIHFTKEDVPPDSALIALSTCYQDGRIVALYKRINSRPLDA